MQVSLFEPWFISTYVCMLAFLETRKQEGFIFILFDNNIIQNIRQGLFGPLLQLFGKLKSCSKYAILCEKSFCFLFTGFNQLEL